MRPSSEMSWRRVIAAGVRSGYFAGRRCRLARLPGFANCHPGSPVGAGDPLHRSAASGAAGTDLRIDQHARRILSGSPVSRRPLHRRPGRALAVQRRAGHCSNIMRSGKSCRLLLWSRSLPRCWPTRASRNWSSPPRKPACWSSTGAPFGRFFRRMQMRAPSPRYCPLASGHLLIGTRKRGVLLYDGKKITVLHPTLSGLYVTTLAGTESDLWVGTLNRGVLHWHAGETESFGEAAGTARSARCSRSRSQGDTDLRRHRARRRGVRARTFLSHSGCRSSGHCVAAQREPTAGRL